MRAVGAVGTVGTVGSVGRSRARASGAERVHAGLLVLRGLRIRSHALHAPGRVKGSTGGQRLFELHFGNAWLGVMHRAPRFVRLLSSLGLAHTHTLG